MTAPAVDYSAPNKHAPWQVVRGFFRANGNDLVALEWIRPSTFNPRKNFDAAGLDELAASIKEHGLLEPIVVREVEAGAESYLEIIAGERRYRAAQLAGLESVSVRSLGAIDDKTALELALVENLQRRDLDPIEEAEGFAALNRVVGLKQAQIATAVHKSQETISNRMRLLKLPADVQELIRRGKLTPSHGIALERFADFPAVCSKIAETAVKEKTTSGALESGFPHSQAVENAKLAVQIGYGARFDQKVCEKCPFDARRVGQYGSQMCLRPAHFEQLQQEADAKRRAELEAAVSANKLTGEPLLKVGSPELPWTSVEMIAKWQLGRVPPGCSDACRCRGQALQAGEPITICRDPARYHALRDAEAKRLQEARDVVYAERCAQLDQFLAQTTAIPPKVISYLVADALSFDSQRELDESFKRHGIQIKVKMKKYQRWSLREKLREFHANGVSLDLVKFAIDVLIRRELNRERQGQGVRDLPFTDWLLGEPKRTELDAKLDAALRAIPAEEPPDPDESATPIDGEDGDE